MFDAQFGVNNRSKYDIYKFAVGELTGLQIILCVSYPVHELTSPRLD